MFSKIATSDGHGEKSPYFDGWKAYENDPYHVTENRDGVIQMGLAENQLCFDLVQDWLKNNPQASICSGESLYEFSDIAIFQDYHGLPEFRNDVANFMARVRGNRVTFNPDRIVMSGGATGAHETGAFCLADPGDAFLLPTPYYPGANMEHFETKQVSKQEPSLIMPLLKRKKEEDDDDVVVLTELSLGLKYEPTAEKIKKPRIDDQKDKFLKANGSVSTELELYRDLWKIKKTLTKSDLGDQSRLLIYKGYVETHVLPSMADEVKQVLHSQDGLRVGVWDYDTHSLHQLDFKKWSSSKSYVLTLNWNKDFVKRRNLKEKDQIALFWDGRTSTFWFRVFHHI